MTHDCKAVRQQDEMYCAECRLRWDADDMFPPECRPQPKRLVIGIAGPAGSGKSTLADYMVTHHGFERVSFAEPIKLMVEALLDYQNVTGDQSHDWTRGALKETPCDLLNNRTPRHAMQTLGTEWARKHLGDDFWVRIAEKRIESITGNVVIDDVRFDNEAAFCDRVILLTGRGGIYGGHASEAGVTDWAVQYTNTGSVNDMREWFDYVRPMLRTR